MSNKPIKLDTDFVNHMGYFIHKDEVEGFDPDTYFDGPILDENGLCENEICQQLGYCRLKCENAEDSTT